MSLIERPARQTRTVDVILPSGQQGVCNVDWVPSPFLPSPTLMSPPTTPTRLPQELVDTIIDELKNNVASLRVCSLVSKPWVHRSRKHLFEFVHLPTCLLRKWLERIPASSVSPLDPHHHVRSLFLQPTAASAPFCVPEAFVDHLSSFTQLSNLVIISSFLEEWTGAFSDGLLVTKYFGGFAKSLRCLELSRVYLNMVALKALLDVFLHLERVLIFSPIMVDEEIKSVGGFQYLQGRRSVAKAGASGATVAPKCTPIRLVDSIVLLLPPTELVVGLANLPLHCREFVLTEECDYVGDTFNVLLNSVGPTLESLAVQNTLDRGESSFPCNICISAHDGRTFARLNDHS